MFSLKNLWKIHLLGLKNSCGSFLSSLLTNQTATLEQCSFDLERIRVNVEGFGPRPDWWEWKAPRKPDHSRRTVYTGVETWSATFHEAFGAPKYLSLITSCRLHRYDTTEVGTFGVPHKWYYNRSYGATKYVNLSDQRLFNFDSSMSRKLTKL